MIYFKWKKVITINSKRKILRTTDIIKLLIIKFIVNKVLKIHHFDLKKEMVTYLVLPRIVIDICIHEINEINILV